MKANYGLIESIFEDPSYLSKDGPRRLPENADVGLCILYAKIWPEWKNAFEDPSQYNVHPTEAVLTQFQNALDTNKKKYNKYNMSLDDTDDGWSLYKQQYKWRVSFTAYPKGNYTYYISIGIKKNGTLDINDIAIDKEEEEFDLDET
jgi:hypothetical protein